jgi:GT2 family glycosyltransferase
LGGPGLVESMSTKRRLDIGVASYRNPAKLRATLESIEKHTHSDWRCFVVHNPSDDIEGNTAAGIIRQAKLSNSRIVPVWPTENLRYAGAVNKIFDLTQTPYVAYLDNDIEILTPGWDERLCAILDKHAEVAQVFPGEGHYGFNNGKYHECLWSAGFAWVARHDSVHQAWITGPWEWRALGEPKTMHAMDFTLGHHEEVDLMIRLRLAGYQIACDPGVSILHHQSSTSDPASAKRIHAGVVRWMNKWNRYFCGDILKYPNPDPDSGEGYDPRSLRYTDWPPCALYLERWARAQLPNLNAAPRTVLTSAGEMDAIEVLKPKGCYVGRAI